MICQIITAALLIVVVYQNRTWISNQIGRLVDWIRSRQKK